MKTIIRLLLLQTFLLLSFGLVATSVRAEQLSCEAAREKLIAPLREAKIQECKSKPNSDPAECERYYANYGDATAKPGGGVSPRMFDDIPECRQADTAK